MKETKPTANAARIVVSTPPLIGRRRRARRRGAGRRRGPAGPEPAAGAAPSAVAAGSRVAAPAARGEHHERERGEARRGSGRSRRRGRSPSPPARRARAARTRATSASLTCAFVLPWAMRSAMNSRCWSATSEVETLSGVRHSRHITSSSMSGSEARGCCAEAAAGAARASDEGEEREQRAHHASSSRIGVSVSSTHSWVIGNRRTAAIRPSRSMTKFSGIARLAPLADEVAVAIAQVRVGEAELADGLQRGAGVLLHVDPDDGPALVLHHLVGLLHERQLVDARVAPRRPDVHQDDLALVVGERAGAVLAEPRQRALGGRRGPLALGHGGVQRRVRPGGREAVGQQPHEQRGGERDGPVRAGSHSSSDGRRGRGPAPPGAAGGSADLG